MSIAVYLRVSTEEQREKQSIETQRTEVERYCEQQGLRVAGIYTDDGVSGHVRFDERPGGARLLEAAQLGRFDTVLVYKLDRLGRDPLVTLLAVEKLKALGVQVRSTSQGFDPDDPVGRLLVTILSGVAGFERETIIQRSIAGMNRLAREGVWLGGIPPFGYRVVGRGKESRLEVAEDPIPGLGMSEADVVRLVYRLTVEEHRACGEICQYLNRLGVPPTYALHGRQVQNGDRKGPTAGVWHPARLRNLITNSVYKGISIYGKRTKRQRDLIERESPAIVSVETWERAQQVLRENKQLSTRNAKRHYLLRGLIKCGLCGHTYIGTVRPSAIVGERIYYICNGRHQSRRIYGPGSKACIGKIVSASLEDEIWRDIEGFLRNPGEVIQLLCKQQQNQGSEIGRLHEELSGLQRVLAAKEDEQARVLALYRRGRISDSVLDQQLDEIEREGKALRQQIGELQQRAQGAERVEGQIQAAEGVLRELNRRLDENLTQEQKRGLIDALVESIRVDTQVRDGKHEAMVSVSYRFGATETCRGSRSISPSSS